MKSWLTAASVSRNQITQTGYDVLSVAVDTAFINQKNLRNRVSYTRVINAITNPYIDSATYYGYDIPGNVDTLM